MVALNVLSLLFVHGALPKKSTVCLVKFSHIVLLFNATFRKREEIRDCHSPRYYSDVCHAVAIVTLCGFHEKDIGWLIKFEVDIAT